MAATDPAALLGAAVRAAVLAKAPRRTVQAVAAAVTGVLLACLTAAASQHGAGQDPQDTTSRTKASADTGASAEELVEALRQARATKRRQKKAKQRLRKAERNKAEEPQAGPPARGGGTAAAEVQKNTKADEASSSSRGALQKELVSAPEPHVVQDSQNDHEVDLEALDPEQPGDFLFLLQEYNRLHGTAHEASQVDTPAEREVVARVARNREMVVQAMTPMTSDDVVAQVPACSLLLLDSKPQRQNSELPPDAKKQPHGPARGTYGPTGGRRQKK